MNRLRPPSERRFAPRSTRLGDVALRVDGRLLNPTVSGGHDVAAVAVHDVTHDSREAGPGILFAARPGARSDGHDYVAEAVAAGSPAALVERLMPTTVPQVRVASVANQMGPAAALVHGDPSAQMSVLGVTGTNGKTSTAFMIEAGLAAAGHVTGLIGTVETRVAGATVPGVRTTPEASDLQRLFAGMRAEGVDAAAMEVSSHGLSLGRVRGTRFAAVGFTNLSHDHLDFHATIEEYYHAKASLFTPEHAPVAVINIDDAAGQRLRTESPIPTVTISTATEPADVSARDVVLAAHGSTFTTTISGTVLRVRLHLPGAFNVANALMALTLLDAAGTELTAAAQGLENLRTVPGRMERVDVGQPFEVIVDYAHSPDALERVLAAVRSVSRGKVVVVIGCGGDRDQSKRAEMGQVAAGLADLAVLTSDNPRSEDPNVILDAVEAGCGRVPDAKIIREVDRRIAIQRAIEAAEDADMVVIAGKGHETTQEINGVLTPFDDRVVAREMLQQQGFTL